MAINPEVFLDPHDRRAMHLLQSIPGFTAVVRLFQTVWNDRNLRLSMLSSKLCVTEQNMPVYHTMLTDICQKLVIDIP